ncbi:MAG TPA: GNAT family protein [Actinomycetota bacterium]|nr:GNAT family protein [Actinomycetota bacterium]
MGARRQPRGLPGPLTVTPSGGRPALDARLDDPVVSVRPWEERDAGSLVTELQDREVSRWVLTIPWPYTDDDAAAFLRFAEEQRDTHRGAHLAVVAQGDGALAGGVALAPIDWDNGSAALGYWTARSFRNRGIARRAGRLLVDWAFGDLGLERIELTCDPANVPSQRVAEELGFQREGHLRGHLRTSEGRRDSLLYGLLAPPR